MKVCFHPHVGTGIQSLDEIDRLMKLTDPALVGLLFDTGHSTIAGEDPVSILKKYIDRVVHIHVKDVRREVFEQVKSGDHSFLWGVKNGMFTVPGDGNCVDWMSIFSILKESDYEGWIVVEAEQDPAKADPLEYAQKARASARAARRIIKERRCSMKKQLSAKQAVDMIRDGAVIMCGGFLGCGTAHRLMDAIAASQKKDLTIICNDAGPLEGPNGEAYYGVAKLIHNHQSAA